MDSSTRDSYSNSTSQSPQTFKLQHPLQPVPTCRKIIGEQWSLIHWLTINYKQDTKKPRNQETKKPTSTTITTKSNHSKTKYKHELDN